MTREELAHALSAIERALANRIIVTRIIVDESGKEIGRITRVQSTSNPHIAGRITQGRIIND